MQPGGYRRESSPDRGTKAADLRQEGACDREEWAGGSTQEARKEPDPAGPGGSELTWLIVWVRPEASGDRGVTWTHLCSNPIVLLPGQSWIPWGRGDTREGDVTVQVRDDGAWTCGNERWRWWEVARFWIPFKGRKCRIFWQIQCGMRKRSTQNWRPWISHYPLAYCRELWNMCSLQLLR